MNMAFGELWLDLSQASFASSQVAVHLDAKFGEVHIRLPSCLCHGHHWNLHPLSSVKVDRFESDLEQVETRLHLSGSLFCTELEVGVLRSPMISALLSISMVPIQKERKYRYRSETVIQVTSLGKRIKGTTILEDISLR